MSNPYAQLPVITPSYETTAIAELKHQQTRLAKWLKVLIIIDAISCIFIFTIPGCAINILLAALALFGVRTLRRGFIRSYYLVYIIYGSLSLCLSLFITIFAMTHDTDEYHTGDNDTNDYNNHHHHDWDRRWFPGLESADSGTTTTTTNDYYTSRAQFPAAVAIFLLVLSLLSCVVFIIRVYAMVLAYKLVGTMDRYPAIVASWSALPPNPTAGVVMPQMPQQQQQPYTIGLVNGQPVMMVPVQMLPQQQQQQQQQTGMTTIPQQQTAAPAYVAAPAPPPVVAPAVHQAPLGDNLDLYPKVN